MNAHDNSAAMSASVSAAPILPSCSNSWSASACLRAFSSPIFSMRFVQDRQVPVARQQQRSGPRA
jgi:hypothetical protein